MTRRGSRAGSSDPNGPRSWVLTVDKQHRLRLREEVASVVPWLPTDAGTIECLAMVGPAGGLVVSPADLPKEHAEVIIQLRSRQIGRQQVGSRIVEYARYAAATWPVPISWEAKARRYTLTLPEGARKLKLAPNRGERAVVFAAGEVLEVWRADEWVAYIRTLARDLDEVRDSAIDQLADENAT